MRSDQLTRTLLLLRQLEMTRGASLQELGDTLPDDYPKHHRTLRRDLAALEAAGFPLIVERVNGRARWRLMDGFRQLPAITFSPSELVALAFGRKLLKPLEGTELHGAVDSALGKAAAALPPPALAYVRSLDGLFSVGLGSHKRYREHRDTIDLLTRAIAEKRTVQLRYFSASRRVTRRREIDPYHLRYAAGALYVIGYCHWRKDVRLFAVDRIRAISVTDHAYQMPLRFDAEEYLAEALVAMRGKAIDVELVFSKAASSWVADRLWHQSQQTSRKRAGRLVMTLRVAETPELTRWVLGFGADVEVVGPPSLREAVMREAKKIARRSRFVGEE